jgi:hypothetical protein
LDSYSVYANGRLIGQVGGFPPQPRLMFASKSDQVFAIPASSIPADHIVVFAVRVWRSRLFAARPGAGFGAPPLVGDAASVAARANLQIHDSFWWYAQNELNALMNVCAAILGFALFLVRRSEREYMWFGIAQVFWSVQAIAVLMEYFLTVPFFPTHFAYIVGIFGGSLFNLLFFHVLLRQPRRLLLWIGGVPVVIPIAYLFAVYLGLAGFENFDQFIALCYTPYTVAVALLILRSARRGNSEAWILLVPFSVSSLSIIYVEAFFALGLQRYPAIAWYFSLIWTVLNWPIYLGLNVIIACSCNLAVCAVLVLRFARSRRDEERLSAEFEAAREVRHVLIPNDLPALPGFQIESVYKPAGQVGGDIFQIIPLDRGGALIAIGDVSGKGMPAAMNQRMLARSQGGFTTCLVLRLDTDGTLTAANAGHIAPYIGGSELDVVNGLPLGQTSSSPRPQPASPRPTASLCSPTASSKPATNKASSWASIPRVSLPRIPHLKSCAVRSTSGRKTTSPSLP